MNTSSSPSPACPHLEKHKEDFPASLSQLQQLIEHKLHVLHSPNTEDQQVLPCEESGEGLWKFAVLSRELTFDLQQLQRQTEKELINVQTQLFQNTSRQQFLTTELTHLRERKTRTEQKIHLCVCRELQASISERLVQCERLVFQEKALSALRNLLTQDLQKYQEETQKLTRFTQKIPSISHRLDQEETLNGRLGDSSMQGKNETEGESNMRKAASSSPEAPTNAHQTTKSEDEVSQTLRAAQKKPPVEPSHRSTLQRGGSIKDLIGKFSSSGQTYFSPFAGTRRMTKWASLEVLHTSKSKAILTKQDSVGEDASLPPSITVVPPSSKTPGNGVESTEKETKSSQIAARIDCPVGGSTKKTDGQTKSKAPTVDAGRGSVADSGIGSESEFDYNKQPDSPSEEDPTTPKAVTTTQNPKYQLVLNTEMKTNGLSGGEADGRGGGGGMLGENGSKRWENIRDGHSHYRGSLESLASREGDGMSERFAFDSPSRVFNSPYATTTSMEYNPMSRMSEFKQIHSLSPATSELNLYSFNSRSTSPIPTPTLGIPTPTLGNARPRFSAYDSLMRRRNAPETHTTMVPNHYSMRSNTLGGPNRKDYIEELTKQLDACQKRNQFLEAESVEMEKERNQIRFEMRGLLVNNEDLLRNNAQLSNEMKRMREQMIEMDRENQAMADRCRDMEIEVKGARDMMVEANTQEYAFNVLQQSLQNQIQDSEENLEKQTLHAQTLAEKLWQAERRLEELELDKDTKTKRTSELNNTIISLETELSNALQLSSQASNEFNLQQKLREDVQMRVEELEEVLLEKDQEVQRLQVLVTRLQGEVSGKLIDKERNLEEEIQLRERLQLQCKQAERTVDDLSMELQSTNQAKEDAAKQLKQAQEKMIDLETDLEELQDSEQRWAAKHKRAIEQTEQLQLKLIQEKDLTDQLEIEKTSLERQLRELRLEVDELQSSRVQEDVISRAESKVKELENALRNEERNKANLANTVSKMERKLNEVTDQMEEEHRIANEQKDLMTQRIRSLKRQLNEAEEESSRKEAQHRHTHRELAEERENNTRLQRQLLDQHLQTKRVDTLNIRQTLDNLKLDLSVDEEDEDGRQPEQEASVSTV